MENRVTTKSRFIVDFSSSVKRSAKTPRCDSVAKKRAVPVLCSESLVSRRFQVAAEAATTTDHLNSPSSLPIVEARELGWSRHFREDYTLENEVLGEGSFGRVRAAINNQNGEKVAVKMLPKRSSGDWEKYSSLIRKEVDHWKILENCPQVVDLMGVYEDDDNLYIVQELCTGGDLQHLLKGNVCLAESEAAQIVIPILKMLSECHEHNICFGDVKPANFMLKHPYSITHSLTDSSSPQHNLIVKTVDFGCSQKLNEDEKLSKKTGTPLYMAPEIFFGWYGLEVDIWAVGMMLYQLIGGKLPFFGDHADQLKKGPSFMIVQAVMDSELELTGSPWDNTSTELKSLIRGLLDLDYNTRLTAKGALHHLWIKQHSPNNNMGLKGPLGNIIKFPGSSGSSVASSKGGNGGSEDGQGGIGN
eukprot:g7595.t1